MHKNSTGRLKRRKGQKKQKKPRVGYKIYLNIKKNTFQKKVKGERCIDRQKSRVREVISVILSVIAMLRTINKQIQNW